MRIFVIGGTGFIGRWVVGQLANQGHTLAVFHRGQTSADLHPTVTHILGDRQNLSALAANFGRFAPDVVLDMVPYTKEDAALVVETFCSIAGRVVAISSMDVYQAYGRFCRVEYGPPDLQAFSEDAPLRSTLYLYRTSAKHASELAYNYEKVLVEQVVMGDAKVAGTVLRLPQVYGPGDPQHRLFDLLKRMIDGRSFILLEEGRAQWRWTRGYVENVAAAIALAVTDGRAAGRIYNVGEKEALAELKWVQRIAQTVGWKGAVKVVPRAVLPKHLALPYDWNHHLAAETSRIRNELGYKEPISADEALRRTIEWQRAHPPTSVNLAQFDYAAEDFVYAKQAGL